MSDFLSHLAARAIAQPSLRPRTRSRFEPAEAEEPALNWPATTTTEEPKSLPAVVQRKAVAPSPLAPHPPSRIEPPTTSTEPIAPPVRGADVSSAQPRESAADAAPERTERPLPSVEKEVIREVEQQTEYVSEPVLEVVEREVRVPVATPAAAPPTPRHRFEREAPRVIRAAPVPTVAEAAVVQQKKTPAGLPAPHRSGAPRRASELASVTVEPVIEVSIGRIEVRAVQPAAAPRGASRPAAMSIDDYVAKRKAKERR